MSDFLKFLEKLAQHCGVRFEVERFKGEDEYELVADILNEIDKFLYQKKRRSSFIRKKGEGFKTLCRTAVFIVAIIGIGLILTGSWEPTLSGVTILIFALLCRVAWLK